MFRIAISLVIFAFVGLVPQALAQTPTPECTIIYGGGEVDCAQVASATATGTVTPSPTRKPQPTTPTPAQTKGGLKVQPPSKATTTPATGPEMLGIIALVPAAAAGLWLRRKTG
jgi:hypothetical protein